MSFSPEHPLLGQLQSQLIDGFPLHRHLGLGLAAHDGQLHITLPDDGPTRNSFGTQSAAALFAAADAASGVALISATHEHVSPLAGVVVAARIRYRRPAVGPMRAVGRLASELEPVLDEWRRAGRATAVVEVDLLDRENQVTATVDVTWLIRQPSESAPVLWRG